MQSTAAVPAPIPANAWSWKNNVHGWDLVRMVESRTIACVGKKLGWEKGFGVDMRCYDACLFEGLGRLAAVVDDDRGHQDR